MILTARLIIEGHESGDEGIALLSCSFRFVQDIDQRGLPKSEVKGGVISLTLNSIDDQEIMQWMFSAKSDKNGKITFASEDAKKVFKTLEFKDARCIAYDESFIRDTEMIQEITLSAREVTISGVTHVNAWTKYKGGA
jgi:hypothetical protein